MNTRHATTNICERPELRRRLLTTFAAVGLIGGFLLLGFSLLITVTERVEHRALHLDWLYVVVFALFTVGSHFLDRAAEKRLPASSS